MKPGEKNLQIEIEYEIKPISKLTLNLKELWQYRELFYFFTLRDVKVRYKETFLGLAWAIIQPLLMMIIFTFIFGSRMLSDNLSEEENSYPVFVFSGLIFWNVF